MPKFPPHIHALRVLRNTLVVKRREAALGAVALQNGLDKSVAEGGDDPLGWQYGTDLLTLQQQIEAVDRALNDESGHAILTV